MSRVLYVGDIHAPCTHPGYLAFCQDIYESWDCDQVVFIGDIADWHAVSFHAHHPDCPGPNDEYEIAYAEIQKWVKAFPVAKVCEGNHDARLIRLAESVNIPSRFIRDYSEVWDTPGWDWQYEHITDDVYAFHGTGNGGAYPAANASKKQLMSTVMGHCHSRGGVVWNVGPNTRIFGMDTGCGIDDQQMAFAYGRHMKQKSVTSCGVVIDGLPYHEMCPIAKGERYHRSRFNKKGKR